MRIFIVFCATLWDIVLQYRKVEYFEKEIKRFPIPRLKIKFAGQIDAAMDIKLEDIMRILQENQL